MMLFEKLSNLKEKVIGVLTGFDSISPSVSPQNEGFLKLLFIYFVNFTYSSCNDIPNNERCMRHKFPILGVFMSRYWVHHVKILGLLLIVLNKLNKLN